MMEGKSVVDPSQLLGGLSTFFRKCLFSVVSVGPIPKHISFIMDGNRRFAKKRNMGVGEGHKAGYLALMTILRYCYELGVKYVTVYAFSIDNFKRRPDEVQILMDLLQEKIDGLLERESIVNQYGVRVYFIGNLKLLNEPVRVAAEKAMKATSNNAKAVLLICVPYSSVDEIVNAVQESCNEKRNEIQALNGVQDSEKLLQNIANVKVVDIERNMYMAVAPDPDIMIRTSGETRLSNFLLWQTSTCPLYFTSALWPELGLGHLVWAVLCFQRNHNYLEKKKKQL